MITKLTTKLRMAAELYMSLLPERGWQTASTWLQRLMGHLLTDMRELPAIKGRHGWALENYVRALPGVLSLCLKQLFEQPISLQYRNALHALCEGQAEGVLAILSLIVVQIDWLIQLERLVRSSDDGMTRLGMRGSYVTVTRCGKFRSFIIMGYTNLSPSLTQFHACPCFDKLFAVWSYLRVNLSFVVRYAHKYYNETYTVLCILIHLTVSGCWLFMMGCCFLHRCYIYFLG